MALRTPLHPAHVRAGARIVDFAGWEMPVNYGSQIAEHQAVRSDAGMFDVSHMLAIDLEGADAKPYLRRLLANDVAKLALPGKALYSCMLNPDGGVIDDLIVYWHSDTQYRIVVNAGTADKDLAWMDAQLAAGGFDARLAPRRDLAMIAVQGPTARARCWQALQGSEAASAGLKPFQAAVWGEYLIARTGYTGEDGFELTMPAAEAETTWQALLDAGVAPCGLGARDTLRLEAGMPLYGNDMDETVSPLAAGLAWTVDLKDPARDFVGRAALEAAPPAQQAVGLVLEDKGVLRAHQKIFTRLGDGETTSGTFSPSLEKSIALGRVPAGIEPGEAVEVDIRGRRVPARVVRAPFVRNGKPLI